MIPNSSERGRMGRGGPIKKTRSYATRHSSLLVKGSVVVSRGSGSSGSGGSHSSRSRSTHNERKDNHTVYFRSSSPHYITPVTLTNEKPDTNGESISYSDGPLLLSKAGRRLPVM